jgi:hypothetical protein
LRAELLIGIYAALLTNALFEAHQVANDANGAPSTVADVREELRKSAPVSTYFGSPDEMSAFGAVAERMNAGKFVKDAGWKGAGWEKVDELLREMNFEANLKVVV